MPLRLRRALLAALLGALSIVAVTQGRPAAAAADSLTVAQAIDRQDGGSGTVRGYVVGQPTATDVVIRSGFPNDYALALADSPGETATARMLYVQITSAFRAAYGLRANPDLMGTRLDVTGTRTAYFAHAGLKSPTAFSPVGGEPPTTPPGDDTYYEDAIGKTGPALGSALHAIISVQTTLSYSQVWGALADTDEDPANAANVILLYSGRSQSQSTHGGDADDWNREHTWAKSHGGFGTTPGPGTDIHHLRPTDVTVNAARGNKDFNNGGHAVAEAPGSYTDADSWEPRDAVKGDVARMLFYMAVRYEGGDGFADLELNDSVDNGTAPYHGRLSVLRSWHQQDPPDAFEQRRNEVIYTSYQHNRNPFIDHPEWVSAIWG